MDSPTASSNAERRALLCLVDWPSECSPFLHPMYRRDLCPAWAMPLTGLFCWRAAWFTKARPWRRNEDDLGCDACRGPSPEPGAGRCTLQGSRFMDRGRDDRGDV